MRLSASASPVPNLTTLIACSLLFFPTALAYYFPQIVQPPLDFSDLGRIALAGDYNSISIYNWIGQNETGASQNGSQTLLGRFPSGAFAKLAATDASIPVSYTHLTLPTIYSV